MGHKKSLTAELNRFLVEMQFVEEYRWLPQDIRKIPYKFIKMYFINRSQKEASLGEKQKIEQYKKQNGPSKGKKTITRQL